MIRQKSKNDFFHIFAGNHHKLYIKKLYHSYREMF